LNVQHLFENQSPRRQLNDNGTVHAVRATNGPAKSLCIIGSVVWDGPELPHVDDGAGRRRKWLFSPAIARVGEIREIWPRPTSALIT
jgi:hypothetical protein